MQSARLRRVAMVACLLSLLLATARPCAAQEPIKIQIGVMMSEDWAALHADAAEVAVRRINQNTSLLPGVELEAVRVDTQSVRQLDGLSHKQCFYRSILNNQLANATALVGFGYSSDLLAMSPLLTERKLLAISHASSSSVFSDKSLHPYVARTTMPLTVDVDAYFEILHTFIPLGGGLDSRNTHAIKLLSCDDSYCQDCSLQVKKRAAEKGITIVREVTLGMTTFRDDPTGRCVRVS